MLLKFTQVIQQNCCQPGRKFKKSFCAVDRLRCQLELSKSETSQFRSDLVFDIVNYVHVIFLHGGLMLFWDIWRVQTSVLLNFYARIVPMLATSFQLITRLRPDCFTFCNTCHVISLYWYFKNCQLKMYCECYNAQLFITFKWEQILQTRSHIMMKSQHNSVLHAFSVPDWSEMCRVVGVLTVLLLLPTQYTAGEIFKMWCQEFNKYLLANIYIDIDITLLISDMDFLYQFNLRLHNFEGFFSNVEKKKIQKLAGLWLVGEVVNHHDHVGLYGSKVAEGCSAFQRRSC